VRAIAHAVLLGAVSVVATGCGATPDAEPRPPTRPMAAESRCVAPKGESATMSSADFPAVGQMSVFTTRRAAGDAVDVHALGLSDFSESQVGELGTLLPDQSRRLLPAQGALGDLFGIPTSEGAVCLSVAPRGAGTCARDLDELGRGIWFMGIDPDRQRKGAPGSVVGMASDDVVAVLAVRRDGTYPARLERNGFAYTLPSGACAVGDVSELIVKYADGSSKRVDLSYWPQSKNC
jgi:hypothetical protein